MSAFFLNYNNNHNSCFKHFFDETKLIFFLFFFFTLSAFSPTIFLDWPRPWRRRSRSLTRTRTATSRPRSWGRWRRPSVNDWRTKSFRSSGTRPTRTAMASWTTTSSSRLCYSIEKFLRACCLGMKQNIGSKKILFDPKKTKNLTPAFFKSNLYPSYLFHTSSIFLCNKNNFWSYKTFRNLLFKINCTYSYRTGVWVVC